MAYKQLGCHHMTQCVRLHCLKLVNVPLVVTFVFSIPVCSFTQSCTLRNLSDLTLLPASFSLCACELLPLCSLPSSLISGVMEAWLGFSGLSFHWPHFYSLPNHNTISLVTRVKAMGQQQPHSLCGCVNGDSVGGRVGEIQTICAKAGLWLEGGKTPVEHVLPWEEHVSVQGGNTGRGA